MAYEQQHHHHQHTHTKQHSNHRRNFWPMYSGMAYGNGNGHPNSNNQNTQNHHNQSEHFLQTSTASTFLQELIDCNRKRAGPVVTGNSAAATGRNHPPPPPAPQSTTESQQHGQQQQHPMPDANANLNNEQWNFMGPKMGGQWGGDKHSAVGGSAPPSGGQNGNQQLEDDFRLEYMVEYMELDEFLTENDIPIESVLHDQQAPQIGGDQDPDHDSEKFGKIQKKSESYSASASSKSMGPPSMVPSPASNSVGTDSNSGSSQIKTECINNQQSAGGTSLGSQGGFDHGGQTPSPSQQNQQTGQEFGGNLTQLQTTTQTGSLCEKGNGSVISLPPPPAPPLPLDQEFEESESGVSAALLRKRKKQMVSDERKDEKYWERRRKNNMAAKRSRDARRAKETQIAIQATILERENKNLTQELSKARAENLLLRERLQKYEPV